MDNRKKNIIFINNHLHPGGGEKSLVNLLKAIDFTKYDVDLLLFEGGEYLSEVPSQVNIRIIDINDSFGPLLATVAKCLKEKNNSDLLLRLVFTLNKLTGLSFYSIVRKRFFGDKSYQAAIGYRPGLCSELAVFGSKAKKKIIWWHHGEFKVNKSEYKKLTDQSSRLVTVSKNASEMLVKEIPSVKNKIEVIPNIVDVSSLEETDSENEWLDVIREEKQNCKWILITLSRLVEEKHIEDGLGAAKRLKQDGYNFSWFIVGDGDLRDQLQNQAEDYGLINTIYFVGNLACPYRILSEADLYVHTSHVESQGIAILEAMALGIPCLIERSEGPLDYIESGKNGIIVDNSAADLYAGLKRILDDKERLLSIKNATHLPEDYKAINIIDKFYKILD